MDRSVCASCPVGGLGVGPRGPEDSTVCIVGEAPGSNELQKGVPFIGQAGALLSKTLVRAGFDEETIYITNALRCRPPVGQVPDRRTVAACHDRLLEEITRHPRTLILSLGNTALRSITGNYDAKITVERGRARYVQLNGSGDILLVPTLHPAAVLRSPGELPSLLTDVEYASALVQGKVQIRHPGTVTFEVVTKGSLTNWVTFLRTQDLLAFDIETSGFNPRLDRILSLSISYAKNKAVVFPEELIPTHEVRDLFLDKSLHWVAHNQKFDAQYLRRAFETEGLHEGVLPQTPGRGTGTRQGVQPHTPKRAQGLSKTVAKDTPGSGVPKGIPAQDSGNGTPATVLVGRYVRVPGKGLRLVRKRLTYAQWAGYLDHRPRPLNRTDSGNPVPSVQRSARDGLRQSGVRRDVGHIPAGRVDDTMLLHYVLSEGNRESHGLKELSADLLGADPDYDKPVKKYAPKMTDSFENVPKDLLYKYNAMDTDHTWQLYQILNKKLRTPNNAAPAHMYDTLIMPASRFLQDVERVGVYVSKPTLQALRRELEAELVARERELVDIAAKVWDAVKYSDWKGSIKVPLQFNPGSSFQLRWVLAQFGLHPKDPRTHKESSNAEALKDLPQIPFVVALGKYRRAQKMLSTYVDGIEERIQDDGRVHATFLLHGTATGRLSSRGPNMQNVPRSKDIRNVFQAPPGRTFVELDYSQVELRVLCYLSGDRALRDIYETGRDLHDEVATSLFGPNFTREQRIRAKFLNFGVAYGRGAESLVAEFKMSKQEASKTIQDWWGTFPEAQRFIRQTRAASRSGRPLESPLGRRRRFGLVTQQNRNALENEAANFPIQSTASDLTLMAAMRMVPVLNKYNAAIVNLVHDSILIECPVKNADKVAQRAKEVMSALPPEVLRTDLPFDVSTSIGDRWGDLK